MCWSGVAFGYEDPLEPARALSGFIRTNRSSLAIMGGEMDGRPLTSDQVNQLATMPGREELVAQLLMRMNSPAAGLVNVLNGPIAALARVLQGHVDNIQQQEA